MEDKILLNEALRLIRVFHDLKQTDLASRIGISKSYLSEIEKGKKSPTMDLVEKYSSEFKIPASSILFFSEQLSHEVGERRLPRNAKGVIANKVIQILQFVESRTATDV